MSNSCMRWTTACRQTRRRWKDQHSDRNEQFEYINRKAQQYLKQGDPVISMDTQKRNWWAISETRGRVAAERRARAGPDSRPRNPRSDKGKRPDRANVSRFLARRARRPPRCQCLA